MSAPDVNIFMVEYWLNRAAASHVSAAIPTDVNKQKDNAGLVTPRIEVKTVWGGWTERRNPVPVAGAQSVTPAAGTVGGVATPAAVWFDMGTGKLAFKVVTKRTDDSSFHDRVVGTIRYLMQLVFETASYTPGQPNPLTLSDRMPYHRIARMKDTGATPQFVSNELQDVTALAFDFVLQIRPTAFPQS